jgi:LDH2 family malate/lactate/ureidoglycolate dehydrogenase
MPDTAPAPARPAKVTVSATDLQAFVVQIFAARGVSPADAETIAEALVWANLRGVDSHGVSRVPRYLELFDKGESKPDAVPTVRRIRAAIAVVDGLTAPGPVAMCRAVDEAVAGARECGIGWAGVNGTVHTGAIGFYTKRAADQGLAAMGIVAGVPNMAYPGSRGAAVATSPLSVAIPSSKHGTVLLDMATAVIALGRLAQLKASGEPLPPGVALTAEGDPTTDPALAAIPVPVGGPKGAGMSLVFELLASGLVGNPIVSEFHGGAPGGRRHRQNGALLAIDISAFLPLDEFRSTVDATVDALKALPLAEGATEILVPGERGERMARARATSGVPLGPKVWKELAAAGEALGVPVPSVVG